MTTFITKDVLLHSLSYVKRAAFSSFAIIGFLWVGTLVSCTAVRPIFYADTDFPRIMAPDGKLATYRRITTGGLGTVLTTRLFIAEAPKGEELLIYESRDSDYVPKLRWLDRETLLVELPCDRVDYISNPNDWGEGSTPIERVAVRFTYLAPCSPTMAVPEK